MLYEDIQVVDQKLKLFVICLFLLSLVLSFTVHIGFVICVMVFGIMGVYVILIKCHIKIYDDSIEVDLLPLKRKSYMIMKTSIEKIDIDRSSDFGIYGLKIKDTPRGSYCYLGGRYVISLKTLEGKRIHFGLNKKEVIEKYLSIDES